MEVFWIPTRIPLVLSTLLTSQPDIPCHYKFSKGTLAIAPLSHQSLRFISTSAFLVFSFTFFSCNLQYGQTTLSVSGVKPTQFRHMQHENEAALISQQIESRWGNMQRLQRSDFHVNMGLFLQWCINGECVPADLRPEGVHGGWASWSEWSACSRTCGAGVQSAERDCDNPV